MILIINLLNPKETEHIVFSKRNKNQLIDEGQQVAAGPKKSSP